MVARHSWWHKIKQLQVAIGVVAIVFVVVNAIIAAGYRLGWTGFNGYNEITIAHTISGANSGSVIITEVHQPGKTLFGWLLLLIIPAVLATAGYIINMSISRGEQAATEQRAKSERIATEKRAETEQKIAEERLCEISLKEYIDKMSELFLLTRGDVPGKIPT